MSSSIRRNAIGSLNKTYSTHHRLFSIKVEPKKTCLYNFHVDHKGKLVDFAGWLLPVQYSETIKASHLHTRRKTSLFDVGHMLQTKIWGRHSCYFIESLTTTDLKNIPIGGSSLTVFTNDRGGILDDLIVTKDSQDKFFVVSNAGRRKEDMNLLLKQQAKLRSEGKDVDIKFFDPLEQGLIALQGPGSAQTLQSLLSIELKNLKFMNGLKTKLDKKPVRITRCGYTGEDGFEISVQGKDARSIAEMILEDSNVKLAGLGSRDSLRLEAGMCLYGHDIDVNTTPVEANLLWLVAKRRRLEANFPGANRVLDQINNGPSKKRVGLILEQGPPARENCAILTPDGELVGKITSGGPSPSLGRAIAMGYVPTELSKIGLNLLVEIRNKTYNAVVTKMPFIKSNYYTGK